ncbi:hypothetical protein KK488_17685 [Sphingobium sp. H33]|uniref:Alpha/beta hydrolase domain-containing protein n=1 Tax=Sphingobium nicotianae TaxID=2782607 RepID=A0A9X1ISR6_9SPHN|nr:hypothetical protein [Sphingobium nicotianae]
MIRSANNPYTTRVLIRRPGDRAKFSGRVIVEMLNPSNKFDLNIGWAMHREEIMRNGDAWVGITAKPVAALPLKLFDPKRYAAISWKNPLPLDDPKNCAVREGSGDTRETETGLVWDIYTQLGAWLRSSAPSNPFRYGAGASKAKRLYGWGYSQTGAYLITYIDAVQPRVIHDDGKPMYDGYMIVVAVNPIPINQCAAPLPESDPRRRRTIAASGVPVMHVMSQSDYLQAVSQRRPDSDNRADPFRYYDISGSGHATPDELLYSARPVDIQKAGRDVPPMNCDQGPRSRFPSAYPLNAILHNLESWVEKGISPPPGQAIRLVGGAPETDKYGNVVGGVRTPYLDAPTSQWNGNSTGQSFCRIAGHEKPIEPAVLKALYPSHEDYVAKVSVSVEELVASRYLTAQDGKAIVAEARRASVP